LAAAPYAGAEIAAAGAQSAAAAARVAVRQVVEEVIAVPVPVSPKFPGSNIEEIFEASTRLGIPTTSNNILVLGRGPQNRLERLATKEGGRISTTPSNDAREIFKQNYRDIRKAERIIQYMDDIPITLDEALQKKAGQFSRAEVYMINQRKDLLSKTIRKFER
jgi:hypothetical protein